ncbi:hypothetical protein V7075_25070 [Neobacillus drentensis]
MMNIAEKAFEGSLMKAEYLLKDTLIQVEQKLVKCDLMKNRTLSLVK